MGMTAKCFSKYRTRPAPLARVTAKTIVAKKLEEKAKLATISMVAAEVMKLISIS